MFKQIYYVSSVRNNDDMNISHYVVVDSIFKKDVFVKENVKWTPQIYDEIYAISNAYDALCRSYNLALYFIFEKITNRDIINHIVAFNDYYPNLLDKKIINCIINAISKIRWINRKS